MFKNKERENHAIDFYNWLQRRSGEVLLPSGKRIRGPRFQLCLCLLVAECPSTRHMFRVLILSLPTAHRAKVKAGFHSSPRALCHQHLFRCVSRAGYNSLLTCLLPARRLLVSVPVFTQLGVPGTVAAHLLVFNKNG